MDSAFLCNFIEDFVQVVKVFDSHSALICCDTKLNMNIARIFTG